MNTVRVTCDCATCTDNATRLGLTAPLAADWTPKTEKAARSLKGAKGRHGLVYSAYDPTFVGQAARAALGVAPVA